MNSINSNNSPGGLVEDLVDLATREVEPQPARPCFISNTSAPGTEASGHAFLQFQAYLNSVSRGQTVNAVLPNVTTGNLPAPSSPAPAAPSSSDDGGSFFGDIWHGITSAFHSVENFVSSAASTVGHWFSSAASTVGHWFSSAAGAVWGGLKSAGGAISDAAKWFAPRAWDALRGLGTGIVGAVEGVARNLVEGAGQFFGGIGKLFEGDFSGGLKDMGMGLLKTFVQTPVDAILMVGGRVLSAIQTMTGLEPAGRELTSDEIATLRQVYGDSIDYSQVRIKEGNSGLFSLFGRPFTQGDTIYIPKGSLPLSPDVLVHEMGHVWQFQHGGTDYMSEALWAQNFGEGYDFSKGIDEGKSFSELNPEQQAELMQQAYLAGFFDPTSSSYGKFIYTRPDGTTVDYTAYLNDALQQVRSGQGAP